MAFSSPCFYDAKKNAGLVFSNISGATLPVPGGVHVDADGGSGSLRSPC